MELADVLDVRTPRGALVGAGHAQDLVVPALLVAHAEHAQGAAADEAAREGGLLQEHERIERVAVLAQNAIVTSRSTPKVATAGTPVDHTYLRTVVWDGIVRRVASLVLAYAVCNKFFGSRYTPLYVRAEQAAFARMYEAHYRCRQTIAGVLVEDASSEQLRLFIP